MNIFQAYHGENIWKIYGPNVQKSDFHAYVLSKWNPESKITNSLGIESNKNLNRTLYFLHTIYPNSPITNYYSHRVIYNYLHLSVTYSTWAKILFSQVLDLKRESKRCVSSATTVLINIFSASSKTKASQKAEPSKALRVKAGKIKESTSPKKAVVKKVKKLAVRQMAQQSVIVRKTNHYGDGEKFIIGIWIQIKNCGKDKNKKHVVKTNCSQMCLKMWWK